MLFETTLINLGSARARSQAGRSTMSSLRGAAGLRSTTLTVALLVFSLSLASSIHGASAAVRCDSGDSAALLAFKAGFVDPGGIFSTWTTRSDCCSWLGVTCSSLGRVQRLVVQAPSINRGFPPTRNLSYSGVVGGTLGNLVKLTTLTLTNVFFNGPAPSSVGKLSLLTSLILGGDNFTGPIPPSWGQLTNLVTLTLNSGFGGSIPAELCNLVKIVSLDISVNSLTGGIPSCIYRWTSISTFGAGANRLSGEIPPIFGALRTLTVLDLSNNLFSGPIPVTLRRLSNLQFLLLSENQLSGPIPPVLSQLTNLISLSLSQNQLEGLIPPQLGSFPHLVYLDLDTNKLSGPIPKELAKLPMLQTLQLLNNRLTGCFPSEFGNVPAANQLSIDIANNYLSCSLPNNLGNIGEFFANNNFFSGAFPLSLLSAVYVDLSSNRLTGLSPTATPKDLPAKLLIETLSLNNNLFTGPFPSWLALLTNLNNFDISMNKIDGALPVAFLQLPVLFQANFSRNHFNKKLPTSTFSSVVGTLDASYNKLFGPIPESFVRALKNVFYLDLSYNRLDGTVPADIVKPGMVFLNLRGNKFTGTVPSVP